MNQADTEKLAREIRESARTLNDKLEEAHNLGFIASVKVVETLNIRTLMQDDDIKHSQKISITLFKQL